MSTVLERLERLKVDLILRGVETAGRETEAELTLGLDGARCTITWQPHQIKTLRWRRGEAAPGAVAPAEVNMLEEVEGAFVVGYRNGRRVSAGAIR